MEHALSVPHLVPAATTAPVYATHAICHTILTQLTARAVFATSIIVLLVTRQILKFAIAVLLSIPSTITLAPSIVLRIVRYALATSTVLSATAISISIR